MAAVALTTRSAAFEPAAPEIPAGLNERSAPAPGAAQGKQLALRLVEFNLHPARFAHPSWFGESSSALASRGTLWHASGHVEARAEPRLSEWLLHELDLHDDMDWEMSEPEKRLWLLDGATLERLAQELALAMHREWLLRVIEAGRLRLIATALGEGALRFVMEGVPRGSFHYHTPKVSFSSDAASELGFKLREAGARTLMALLRPAWRAVRGRAQLYLERSKGLGAVPAFEAVHREQALEFICGRLIPRRFPEWAWCF